MRFVILTAVLSCCVSPCVRCWPTPAPVQKNQLNQFVVEHESVAQRLATRYVGDAPFVKVVIKEVGAFSVSEASAIVKRGIYLAQLYDNPQFLKYNLRRLVRSNFGESVSFEVNVQPVQDDTEPLPTAATKAKTKYLRFELRTRENMWQISVAIFVDSSPENKNNPTSQQQQLQQQHQQQQRLPSDQQLLSGALPGVKAHALKARLTGDLLLKGFNRDEASLIQAMIFRLVEQYPEPAFMETKLANYLRSRFPDKIFTVTVVPGVARLPLVDKSVEYLLSFEVSTLTITRAVLVTGADKDKTRVPDSGFQFADKTAQKGYQAPKRQGLYD